MPQTTRSVASVAVVLAVFLAALVSTVPVASAATGCGKPIVSGKFTRPITVNGVRRTYLLIAPSTLRPTVAAPVVMGLHGGSDTAENAYRYMALNGSEPSYYVFPQAPYWPEAGGVGWNVDPAGVDFPYFDALVADLKTRYCIDATRLFAAGKSNGGFMVNALACFRPGMFRGVASVAGGGPQTSRCQQGTAAMIVHGTNDQVVRISSGQWSLEYHLWSNGYRSGSPTATSPSPCVQYPGTTRRVLWCQHTGGHIWPTWAGTGIRRFFLAL